MMIKNHTRFIACNPRIVIAFIVFLVMLSQLAIARVVVNDFGNHKFTSGDAREIFSILEEDVQLITIDQAGNEIRMLSNEVTQARFKPFGSDVWEDILLEEVQGVPNRNGAVGHYREDHFWRSDDGYINMQISFLGRGAARRGAGIYSYLNGKYIFSIGPREVFQGNVTEENAEIWDERLFAPQVGIDFHYDPVLSISGRGREHLNLDISVNYGSATVTLDPTKEGYDDFVEALDGVAGFGFSEDEANDAIYEYQPSSCPVDGRAYLIPKDVYLENALLSFDQEGEDIIQLPGVIQLVSTLGAPTSTRRMPQSSSVVCPIYRYEWRPVIDLSGFEGEYVIIVEMYTIKAETLVVEQLKQISPVLSGIVAWSPAGSSGLIDEKAHFTAGGIRLILSNEPDSFPRPTDVEAYNLSNSDGTDDADLLPDNWEIERYASVGYTDGTRNTDFDFDYSHDIWDYIKGHSQTEDPRIRIFVDSDHGVIHFNKPWLGGGCFYKQLEGLNLIISNRAAFGQSRSHDRPLLYFVERVESNRRGVLYSSDRNSFEEARGIDVHPWLTEEIVIALPDLDSSERISVTWVTPDDDGDGLPNDFEQLIVDHYVDLSLSYEDIGPNDDHDGDGLSNLLEYSNQWSPVVFGLGDDDLDRDKIRDNLENDLFIFYPNSSRFDRLDPSLTDTDQDGVIDGDEDYDNDRLKIWEEILAGTDPNRADTDGDSVSDFLEIFYGISDPLVFDLYADNDSDGDLLNDLDEFLLGTNPWDADSNQNGFTDFEDIQNGVDPRAPDGPPVDDSDDPDLPPDRPPVVPPIIPPPPPVLPFETGEYRIMAKVSAATLPKHGYKEYQLSMPPKRYLKRVTRTSFSGGNPESGPVGYPGNRTSTVDPKTGVVTSKGNGAVGSADEVVSRTVARGDGELSSYDDPPNRRTDDDAETRTLEVLSNENTTADLISNTKEKVDEDEADPENIFFEQTPRAYRNLGEDELAFRYQRCTYRFEWDDDTTEEQRYKISWVVLFEPEDDPETENVDESCENRVTKVFSWSGDGSQSPEYELDPDSMNSGSDGTYTVIPIRFKVSDFATAGSEKVHLRNLDTKQDEDAEYVDFEKLAAHHWTNGSIELIHYLEGSVFHQSTLKKSIKFRVNGVILSDSDDFTTEISGLVEPDEHEIEKIEVEVLSATDSKLIDRLMITSVPRTTVLAFEAWYQQQSMDTGWLSQLPKPYASATVIGRESVNGTPLSIIAPGSQCDTRLWEAAKSISTRYHPDGDYVIRSTQTAGGHGHQAAYKGMNATNDGAQVAFISGGVSAGSADRSHPSNLTGVNHPEGLSHKETDVLPFIHACQLDGNPIQAEPNASFPFNLDHDLGYEGRFIERYLELRPAQVGETLLSEDQCE